MFRSKVSKNDETMNLNMEPSCSSL